MLEMYQEKGMRESTDIGIKNYTFLSIKGEASEAIYYKRRDVRLIRARVIFISFLNYY